MPVDGVPERIRWAVETLAIEPTDRLLEIGCGGGVAVALIGARLSTGTITAIDRSATMTERARRRNAELVAAGRAAIHTAPFRAADMAAAGVDLGPYDKVFAINVNVFWTGPAREETALAGRLLAPGGAFYACYEPPGDRTGEIIERVSAALAAGGFAVEALRSPAAVAVVGRRSPTSKEDRR